MIPYGRQDIDASDLAAVEEILRSDWLTQGPAVPRFEAALRDRTQAGHAIAVTSATAALHLTCLALGIGPGDVVWTVPNTFVASANCARYCGAEVDFVDIEADTHNMSAAALAAKLADARARGRLPKLVIPVHFAGHPCDMAAISRLCAEHGVAVLEDASHAIGASYAGRPVGSGRWSAATVFSFHPVKIVTTGEGGAVLSNDAELAARVDLLRSHGITRDPARMERPDPEAAWYYEQVELGFNYRMTDIQAGLGTSQLRRLDAFLARRRRIAALYGELLAGLNGLRLPVERADVQSSWHLYTITVDGGAERRRRLFQQLRADGIGVQVHYMPVHCQPYYRRLGFGPGQFPEAEKHGDSCLSLPIFPAMTDSDVTKVADIVRNALTRLG
jgi:UDP-4-amino-4,6-dideoxy-N-acetyl-beta-L-altrosamine transaminase